jgi:hypothetical protein
MFWKNKTEDPADFWREYGEKHGEKVLAYAMGQYLSGWAEYGAPFWGLLIATDGGFRVHHFPQENWLQVLSRGSFGGGKAPEEKTIFIPKDRLLSGELRVEKVWWKKIFFPSWPRLIIRYRDAQGAGAELAASTEKDAGKIVRALFPVDGHWFPQSPPLSNSRYPAG